MFDGPVEPGTAQQAVIAAIEPGMHAVAVEFELVRPLVAIRRFRDQLRLGPCRECGFRRSTG
jgi:hypothetical protein